MSMTDMTDLAAAVRRATLRLSLIYWICMFVADSLLGYFIHIDPLESAPLKFVLFGASALMTYVMSLLLFRMRGLSFTQKALFCFLMTAVTAPIFTAIDFIDYMICKYPQPVKFDPTYSGYMLIEGASMLFGWSCLFVALLYNFEVRDRERRLAAVREEALTAQMRALRYQVNPHFLFNTLNSIAGLIEEGAATRAERMVLSLATFMRATLSLDPMHDVPLADELALQKEYLEIERERFSGRMTFRIDMPAETGGALVPSLILQPLIENAIKHGIGTATGEVEILLKAYREADRLRVVVENDIPPCDTAGNRPPGMGVGLRNVAERLNARFQGDSQFSSGPVAPGRYRVSIDMPWRLA
ncbi:sensor histidine kinase [Methylomicrobium agile]|uniref:sensor histidine kinase n=1 Tax=Methylomicrobium agile TaxID=39774 RepID=UPI000690873D|nr:histidine kinase [Methylomicrobium agile]